MFFGDCNINKKDDLVFIKYANSCSLLFCEKYIYEVKGGGVDLSYIFFQKKYMNQTTFKVNKNINFLILHSFS